MAIQKARKAAAESARDLPEFEQLPGRLISEATKSQLRLQYLSRHFGLTQVRSELIAHLAFDCGRRL